jgi:hypothetical protein
MAALGAAKGRAPVCVLGALAGSVSSLRLLQIRCAAAFIYCRTAMTPTQWTRQSNSHPQHTCDFLQPRGDSLPFVEVGKQRRHWVAPRSRLGSPRSRACPSRQLPLDDASSGRRRRWRRRRPPCSRSGRRRRGGRRTASGGRRRSRLELGGRYAVGCPLRSRRKVASTEGLQGTGLRPAACDGCGGRDCEARPRRAHTFAPHTWP